MRVRQIHFLSPIRGRILCLTAVLLSCVLPSVAAAQVTPPAGVAQPPSRADHLQGNLTGILRDAETGLAIGGAHLRLRELGRDELSHGDGQFHFARVRGGTYTLVAERIGYARLQVEVEIVDGQNLRLEPLRGRTP